MNLRLLSVIAVILLSGCSQPLDQPTGEATPTERDEQVGFEILTAAVEKSIEAQKFDEAFELSERALELQPDDRETLFTATQLAQHHAEQLEKKGGDGDEVNKLFLKSADYLRRAQDGEEFSASQLPYARHVFFNEARAFAQTGEETKALAALTAALEAGFSDFQTLDAAAEFATLRQRPEFEQAVTPRRDEHRRLLAEKVKTQLASHKPYPFDFELVSIAGETVKLADYEGKVLVVDFWGTWCPPCRMEIPHFVALLDNYQSEGFAIVGINYENGDATEAQELITEFVKEYGVTYPCLLGDEATLRRVPGFNSFPTTLFIDPSGKVRLQVSGYHPYEHLEAIVQTLLSEANDAAGN